MSSLALTPMALAAAREAWKPSQRPLRRARCSVDRASFHMLQLYRTNLEVRLQGIDETALQTESQKRTYALAAEMLRTPSETASSEREIGWDETYKVERMIGLLLSGTQLRQEIKMRLDELASERASEAVCLRAEHQALVTSAPGNPSPAPDDTMLRSFLLRVMEVLHWNAKKKHLARPIRKEATKNILLCGIVAFLLAITPYVAINVDFVEGLQLSKWWSLFALYTALVSGLLGAFFSRLITVQRDWPKMSLDEVFLHREFSYTLLRAGVGMGGAIIVYFFLKSGLIDGALFPKFEKLAMEWVQVPDKSMSFVIPSKDLALMTVWCFLAGFSEVLVPNLLTGAERQLADGIAPSRLAGK